MDDNELSAMRAMSAGIQAARRLAVYLWKTHYSTQSPNWKLADDLHGVIDQIDNMTTGLVKPVKPVPLPERRQQVRNILYRRLPSHIHGNICRDIADELFQVFVNEQPNFRMRMETFFRRHDMDDKQPGIHPAPTEFTDEQLKLDPVLRYFHYAHLPPMLQPTSAVFCRAARYVVDALPNNAERTVALRKLLEAKDAAVRANVPAAAPAKLQTFYDRLLVENQELQERKAKLWDFIQTLGFLDLPSDEQFRMRRQHTAMDEYAQILGERISNARHIQKQRDGQPSASETFEQAYERAQQTRGYVIPPDIQSEQIDENVRITGGGKSEEPLPFSD